MDSEDQLSRSGVPEAVSGAKVRLLNARTGVQESCMCRWQNSREYPLLARRYNRQPRKSEAFRNSTFVRQDLKESDFTTSNHNDCIWRR